MPHNILARDFFDDFFGFPFCDDKDMRKLEKKLYGHRSKELMRTDIKETKSAYKLEMDIPGFNKDEIQVSLKDGYMTIRAAKDIKKDETDNKSERYLRRERYSGICERSFYIGDDITEEDIKAEFKHGILKLTIPKKEQNVETEEKKYIDIEG